MTHAMADSETLPSIDTLSRWQEQGLLQQAEQGWRQWLARDPNHGEVLNNLANLYKAIDRPHLAEALYRHAITVRPHHIEALNNLGNLLKGQGQFDEAQALLRQALDYAPDHPDIRNNLAVLLHECGQMAEAEQHFLHILQRHPLHIEALNNVGNLLKDSRRNDAAQTCYRQVLKLHPEHAEARWNLGLLLLLRGDQRQGWPLYEARHDPRRQNREVKPPTLGTPGWQGEPLTGRHLLVWPEQGHGDEIQFARYLPELKQRFGAARVTVICKPPLTTLLRSLPHIDQVLPLGATPPAHDCWVLIGSLPGIWHRLGHLRPGRLPYLRAPQTRCSLWRQRLQEVLARPTALSDSSAATSLPSTHVPMRLRVGLAWAGSALHKNDRHRSLPSVDVLAPLWQIPGIDFISLQVTPNSRVTAGSAKPSRAGKLPAERTIGPLLDLTNSIHDFADSAALLGELDLVITVDSALAHLAGALARPCWVLLPWQGLDWRWGESAEHSAWYPGCLRLFRQRQGQSWDGLIPSVTEALSEWREQQMLAHRRLRRLTDADRQRLSRLADGLLTATQGAD